MNNDKHLNFVLQYSNDETVSGKTDALKKWTRRHMKKYMVNLVVVPGSKSAQKTINLNRFNHVSEIFMTNKYK